MILITGGTGAMGTVLVKHFRSDNQDVRVLTLPGDRGADAVRALGADVRFGDISRREDLVGLCDGVTTVYHLAAIIIAREERLYDVINVHGTEHILEESKRAGVGHFVHVSSASVVYPKPTPYSRSKQQGEALVTSSGLNWTIIRPTLVYGKKGGLEFDLFLDYLRRFPVVPFIGSGAARKRPVYVDDIISGLIALQGRTDVYGKTYNFSGGESISIRAFARLCLRLMGQEKKPIIAIPVWLCGAFAAVLRVFTSNAPLRWPVIAGMIYDADLDPAQAREDLGYSPSMVSEKLRECFPR